MIKEYEEVKLFIDRYVSCRFLDAAVVVDEIYTEEYNALDVRIIGNVLVSDIFFIDFRYDVKKDLSHIVDEFEMISGITVNQTSIIVYLKPVIEIRSNKITKIKSKILI